MEMPMDGIRPKLTTGAFGFLLREVISARFPGSGVQMRWHLHTYFLRAFQRAMTSTEVLTPQIPNSKL
jgi:hypothetical protein